MHHILRIRHTQGQLGLKENEKIKDKRVKLRSHKLRGPKHYLLSTYFQEYTSYKVNIKSSSDWIFLSLAVFLYLTQAALNYGILL